VNTLRDDESTKNEQNEILLTILQNIRTIQYSCEECLMHLDMSEEPQTQEVDKEAN
jgi:predicted secreted protein